MSARTDTRARRRRSLDELARSGVAVRARLRRRADHAAVARDADDRPLPAGPRRARQRHARLGNGPDPRDRAEGARLQDRGVRRRVSARSPVRSRPRLRRVQRPPPARPDGKPAERTPGVAGRRRSDRAGSHYVERSTAAPHCPTCPTCPSPRHVLPLGPPLRAARALRRRVGSPAGARSVRRGDCDADREIGRLLDGARRRGDTLVVVAGDHGEAFGEHGEYAHSIFVYDTTLRVPLADARPGHPGRHDGVAATPVDAGRRRADGRCALLGVARCRTSTASISRRRSPAARCRGASSTPSRSRRSSSSAGRRCARSDRDRGSSSRRRNPSSSTSSRTPPSRPMSRRRSRPSRATLDARVEPVFARRDCRARAPPIDASGRSACARSATLRVRRNPHHEPGGGPIRRIGATLAARIAQVTSGELSGPALIDGARGDRRATIRATVRRTLRLGYARAAGR